MGIVKISERLECIRVLHHRLLGRWAVYPVGAHYGCI
jgi:hypothetical protein